MDLIIYSHSVDMYKAGKYRDVNDARRDVIYNSLVTWENWKTSVSDWMLRGNKDSRIFGYLTVRISEVDSHPKTQIRTIRIIGIIRIWTEIRIWSSQVKLSNSN